jgi:DNA-binding NtrC family response regulator
VARILVCDDQELMRDSLVGLLAREAYEVVAASDGAMAVSKLESGRFDLLITDLRMPRMGGMDLLVEARRIRPEMPVVLMTAFASVQTAVEAMKAGAYDYIQKPFEGDEIKLLVERTLEHSRLKIESAAFKVAAQDVERPLIGGGFSMSDIKARLELVGKSSATVLVRGESGTGKEVVARYIHSHSPRAERPFLAVNCAALSENLLESELFGHEKGAFTGADKMRRGRFELADGGTLLLDEVSEIAPALQAKLLRVLQESAFERVGSSVTQRVDVRVIATSNRRLEDDVAAGKFREDLFYRLNVVPIDLPPLRQRLEDVAELAKYFLQLIAKKDRSVLRHLEPAAMRALQQYPWPGNVRELQNIIERACVLETEPGVIRATTIEPWLRPRSVTSASAAGVPMAAANGSSPHAAAGSDRTEASVPRDRAPAMSPDGAAIRPGAPRHLADIEREVILSTLSQFRGHRVKTAHALGIGVRTLGMKLKKWKEEGVAEAMEV